MARILFITWDGGGNQPPAIGMAQEFKRRGHTVIFAGYESQRSHFEKRGFIFVCINPCSNWMDLPPEQRLGGRVCLVWANPDHLQTIPALVTQHHPDALVVDCMMYAALAAVEKIHLPSIPLVHTPPGITAPGEGFDQFMMGPINQVRTAAGLSPVKSSWETWTRSASAGSVLCTTLAVLDPRANDVPPAFQYIGPIFEEIPPSGWLSPWPAGDPRPLILGSFSTHAAWEQRSRIMKSVEAFSAKPYRVLVTTGMANTIGIPIPENIYLVPFVPHEEVLPSVRIVITHAGHGTVASSLAHGIPMIMLPNSYSDQPGLAAQVQSLGAGILLDGEAANPDDIARAVDRMMAQPAYAAAAHRLALMISATKGAAAAASRLEDALHRKVASGLD